MPSKKNTVSRRSFLSRSMTGVTAGFIGLHGTARSNAPPDKDDQEMIRRTLGKTGIELPIVSMGVMNTQDAALVKISCDRGVRHFDTAAMYMRGNNEVMLGKAIKHLGVREDVIIATKVYVRGSQRTMTPDEAKAYYIESINKSLKRLQTDYVDILYSHNVKTLEWLNNPGIIEALQQIKKEGKARFIGFTTHTNMDMCIKDAMEKDWADVILTSINYSMSEEKEYLNTLKKAADQGIGLIAMKTQCQQDWYRETESEERRKFYKGDVVHTALLKWALHHDYFATAIPGYTTFQQMEEDLSVAYSLDYTDKEKSFLEDSGIKLAMTSVCRLCAECVSTCPKKANIPDLMRTHMYAVSYGNAFQARDTMNELKNSIRACIDCGTCTAHCMKNVNIPKRIDELKMIYT